MNDTIKRKAYDTRFDTVSMILSFMVVMIHSSYAAFYTVPNGVSVFLDDYYTDYISGFAVPCFFMLSAIKFYKSYDISMTGEKLKRRISTLLVPYLTWNFLSVVWIMIFSYVPFLSQFVSVREKFVFSFENLIGGVFWFKYIHPFWYMALLLILTLLCPLVYYIIRNKYIGLAAVIVLYIIDALPLSFPETAWPMFQVRTLVYCLAFYILGAWIGKYAYGWFMKHPKPAMRWVAILMFVAAVCLRAITNNSDIAFIPAILLGGYAIWAFVGTLRNPDNDIMKSSFFIYPAHTFILPCVNKVLYFVLPNSATAAILNTVLGTILTYALCVILSLLSRRIMPGIIWKALNGR